MPTCALPGGQSCLVLAWADVAPPFSKLEVLIMGSSFILGLVK